MLKIINQEPGKETWNDIITCPYCETDLAGITDEFDPVEDISQRRNEVRNDFNCPACNKRFAVVVELNYEAMKIKGIE